MQKVEQKNQGRHNRFAYASGPSIATVIKLQNFIDSMRPCYLQILQALKFSYSFLQNKAYLANAELAAKLFTIILKIACSNASCFVIPILRSSVQAVEELILIQKKMITHNSCFSIYR